MFLHVPPPWTWHVALELIFRFTETLVIFFPSPHIISESVGEELIKVYISLSVSVMPIFVFLSREIVPVSTGQHYIHITLFHMLSKSCCFQAFTIKKKKFIYLFLAVLGFRCGARSSPGGGISCCGARAPGARASVVVAHRLSCSGACGIFPEQGPNPCPLRWQVHSEALRPQGSPSGFLQFLTGW